MQQKLKICLLEKVFNPFYHPIIWLILVFFSSFNSDSITKGLTNPTIDSIINLHSPDTKLLQTAIINRINSFRLNNKVKELMWSDTLYQSSNYHMDQMKSKMFFAHADPNDKNYPDLKKRVERFSGRYLYLSENLIQYFPFKFKGKIIEYKTKKTNSDYQYLDKTTLNPLLVLTYKQLSNLIVSNWEASPTHKQNMLNDKYNSIGVAINFPKYFKTPDLPPITIVSNFGGYK